MLDLRHEARAIIDQPVEVDLDDALRLTRRRAHRSVRRQRVAVGIGCAALVVIVATVVLAAPRGSDPTRGGTVDSSDPATTEPSFHPLAPSWIPNGTVYQRSPGSLAGSMRLSVYAEHPDAGPGGSKSFVVVSGPSDQVTADASAFGGWATGEPESVPGGPSGRTITERIGTTGGQVAQLADVPSSTGQPPPTGPVVQVRSRDLTIAEEREILRTVSFAPGGTALAGLEPPTGYQKVAEVWLVWPDFGPLTPVDGEMAVGEVSPKVDSSTTGPPAQVSVAFVEAVQSPESMAAAQWLVGYGTPTTVRGHPGYELPQPRLSRSTSATGTTFLEGPPVNQLVWFEDPTTIAYLRGNVSIADLQHMADSLHRTS